MKCWSALVIALALLLSACSNTEDPKLARAKRAATAKGDIVIGAVWPWVEDNLWQGIELGVEEINANGGVLNRKLSIVKEDDESSLAKGRLIAEKFAGNPDMVAVIGHLNSYIAMPASTTYQSAGMLYLTPGASTYQLNNQSYDLVFRSIPSNRCVGRQMAEYMAAQGFRRVAIYYVKDKANQDMANYFEQRARELGLAIADRRSYIQGSQDFSTAIQNWRDLYQFDALFLASNIPDAAYFIVQARKMGLSVPIFGDDGLDTPRLMEIAGAAAEGIVVPEVFTHADDSPAYSHFSEIFIRKFRQQPDTSAARGYDAVHLLAHAIRQAKSTVPEQIALALHATHQWPGATGEFTFNDKGDLPNKKIGMKRVSEGKFVTVQ